MVYTNMCTGYTKRRKAKSERRGRAIVAVSARAWRDLDQKKTTVKRAGLFQFNVPSISIHKRGKVPNYKKNITYGKCRRWFYTYTAKQLCEDWKKMFTQ
jgi:hypothetical protein